MTVEGAIESSVVSGAPVRTRAQPVEHPKASPLTMGSLDPTRLAAVWDRTARRALKFGGLLALTANFCVSAGLLMSEPAPMSSTTVAAAALAVLTQLLIAASLLRGSSGWPWVAAAAATTVTMLVAAAANPADQLDRAWWPSNIALNAVGYLVLVRPGRVGRSVGLLVAATAVATDFWRLASGTGLTRMLIDATLTATTAAYVILFVHALNRAIAIAETSVQSMASAGAAVTVERGGGRRARDFERFIHDKVIDTLHAISLDRAVVDTASAQRLASDLKARLDEFVAAAPTLSGPRDLGAAIREVAAKVPVTARLRVRSGITADGDVVAAIAAASEEALRNVVRHSGTTRATVSVTRDASGARVVITDRGKGFDPNDIPTHRQGLRSSVHERMADVQGSARVFSSPGQGTKVSLVWHPFGRPSDEPSPAEAAYGLMTPALRDFGRVATPTFWWVTIAMILLAHRLAHPWAAVAATGLVLATGALYWWRAFGPGLSARDHLALTVVAVGASVANGLALQPGETDMARYWLAGGSTPLILLGILLRPMRESVWSAAAAVAAPIITLTLTQGGLPLSAHTLPAIIAAPLAVSCAFAVRLLIDRFSAWLVQTEDAAARAWAREQVMESSHAQVTERALEISRLTSPLVTAVAEGFRDPADPRIQDEARTLERWLRDDLALKDLPKTRHIVWSARRGGWLVTVRNGDVSGATLDDLASRLVGALRAGDNFTLAGNSGRLELTLRQADRVQVVSAVVHGAPEKVVRALVAIGNTSGVRVLVEPSYVHVRGVASSDPVLQ